MDSLEVSRSKPTLDAHPLSVGEALAHFQTVIIRNAPVVVGMALHVADKLTDSVQRLLKQPSSMTLPLPMIPSDHPDLSKFDNLVGRLMFEARQQYGLRIPAHEYIRITNVIDSEGFKPVQCLEGQWRKNLATSNRDARKAIHTFEAALRSRFRRGALKRLYRAYEKWIEKHPHLSG